MTYPILVAPTAADTAAHRAMHDAPLPRIDPWRNQLDELLLANEGKSARERLTLIRIFEELRGFGYGAATTRFGATRRGGGPNAVPQ